MVDDEGSLRARVVAVARGVLDGSVDVLEGSRRLSTLLGRLELPQEDEDLEAFLLIDSETDSLPVGAVRGRWSAAALEELEPRLAQARMWALAIANPSCHRVIARFAPLS
jgi:hypothetical protein